jgi:hypothetical protein
MAYHTDGLDLSQDHLPRTHLIDRMNNILQYQRFLLLYSSAASGKTSLMKLFANQDGIDDDQVASISCLDSQKTGFELLRGAGIDLHTRKFSFTFSDRPIYIIIDDAQAKYSGTDLGFWTMLVKAGADWLPSSVKFIIASTHLVAGGVVSPVEFASMNGLLREDLLLTREEYELLMNSSIGLTRRFYSKQLKEILWRECGRLIGAIILAISNIKVRFSKDEKPSELALLDFYMSNSLTQRMARCFGSQHSMPVGKALTQLVQEMLLGKTLPCPTKMDNTDDLKSFEKLQKSGLVVVSGGNIHFSSPMARRYYRFMLFPYRSASDEPTSLISLIQDCLCKFPASVLRDGLARAFPKEAVFQHWLNAALASCTPQTCSIWAELSEIFPDSNDPHSLRRINGEIDFFIDGNLRWGIELLVKGGKIGEHLDRFSIGGKYQPLCTNDYIVVDFRPGPVSNIQRDPHRFTVFFDTDFSGCSCIVGMQKDPVRLELSP